MTQSYDETMEMVEEIKTILRGLNERKEKAPEAWKKFIEDYLILEILKHEGEISDYLSGVKTLTIKDGLQIIK